MENLKLEASERKINSKGDLKKLRIEGLLPGILYGDKEKNLPLSVKKISIKKLLESSNFMSSVIEIDINGSKHKVLPKDINFHPLSNEPIHIDFQKIKAGTKVTVNIPVKFINNESCPGLKMGGVLNIVRRKIELRCAAENIPSEIIVDLANREMNESIHISAVKLPEGAKPIISDRDFTIATIAAPTVVKEPEPAAAGTEAAAGDAAAAPAEGGAAPAAGDAKPAAEAKAKGGEAAKSPDAAKKPAAAPADKKK
jgi:large subunit ribosomal protein L25